MASYKNERQRRKPMAEINVVPYIDVMLVLLIIFMITAPILTQGISVDLPTASANAVAPNADNSEPLVVSVDGKGLFYVAIGDKPDQAVPANELQAKVAAVLRRNPNTQVMIKGDSGADYGQVVTMLTLLKQAGASGVGLITKQPEPIAN